MFMKLPELFFDGGGGWIYPPIFICEDYALCWSFFWVDVLKLWAFLTYLYIYLLWIDIKTKLKYVKNAHIFKTTTQKKINTVHNLNTELFSLSYCTNKKIISP